MRPSARQLAEGVATRPSVCDARAGDCRCALPRGHHHVSAPNGRDPAVRTHQCGAQGCGASWRGVGLTLEPIGDRWSGIAAVTLARTVRGIKHERNVVAVLTHAPMPFEPLQLATNRRREGECGLVRLDHASPPHGPGCIAPIGHGGEHVYEGFRLNHARPAAR